MVFVFHTFSPVWVMLHYTSHHRRCPFCYRQFVCVLTLLSHFLLHQISYNFLPFFALPCLFNSSSPPLIYMYIYLPFLNLYCKSSLSGLPANILKTLACEDILPKCISTGILEKVDLRCVEAVKGFSHAGRISTGEEATRLPWLPVLATLRAL